MRKLDKAAVALGLAGTWVYMAGVDQDRWAQALIGSVVIIGSMGVYKIGEKLEEKRKEREELEEKRRDAVFAAWIQNGSLKG